MRLPLAVWGNRLGKTAIIGVVVAAVGGTGWLAGHGAASPPPPREDLPVADLSPQVITVAEGSIVSRLTVDAAVEADPPIEVRTRTGGSVVKIYRRTGQKVAKGVPILAIRSVPGDSAATTPPGGGTTPEKPKAGSKPVIRTIYAGSAGRIAALQAPMGKQVEPGETVASIDRRRFRAVGSIAAKDVYRLYKRPKSIKLAIDHGPAPFTCKLIDYGAGAAGGAGSNAAGGDDSEGPDGGGDGSAGVQISCRVPASQRVFSGVQAKMSITTDAVVNAVVIPLGAVLGQADTGRVTVVTEDGRREVRTVKLGLNDGSKVEVVKGLEAGDQILDRAPDDAAFSGPPESGRGGEGPEGGIVGVPAAPVAP